MHRETKRRVEARCARDVLAADIKRYCYGRQCLRKLGCTRLKGIRVTFFSITKGGQEQHLQDQIHEEEAVSDTKSADFCQQSSQC